MNPDRRANPSRRRFTPRAPREEEPVRELGQVAAWLIAEVRAWPATVEDRDVAVRIGVGAQQVRRARRTA
jgi:hypothetical protein